MAHKYMLDYGQARNLFIAIYFLGRNDVAGDRVDKKMPIENTDNKIF